MKIEIQYRWRVKWVGRWTTTNYHCTEDHIRREHPEAQAIEHTRRELQVPETAEEWAEAWCRTDTSKLGWPALGSVAYRTNVYQHTNGLEAVRDASINSAGNDSTVRHDDGLMSGGSGLGERRHA